VPRAHETGGLNPPTPTSVKLIMAKERLELKDIIWSEFTGFKNSYSKGSQKLKLTFNSGTGKNYEVIIEAERGSDLWVRCKQV
jgi:hypothetical protein